MTVFNVRVLLVDTLNTCAQVGTSELNTILYRYETNNFYAPNTMYK